MSTNSPASMTASDYDLLVRGLCVEQGLDPEHMSDTLAERVAALLLRGQPASSSTIRRRSQRWGYSGSDELRTMMIEGSSMRTISRRSSRAA